MARKVFDMTDQERYEFEDQLTFCQLDNLDEDEVKMLDPDVIYELVYEEDIVDIEDRIYYKERFNIDLDDEEEDYLNWADKVDYDLGPPIAIGSY